MTDLVIFPQISGLNWPSHVLQVWLTLHALGVPDENLRFLPELAHFSVPEVSLEEVTEDPNHLKDDADQLTLRHPRSPTFDPASQRLIVSAVNPAQIRPRLKVSVRAETRIRFGYDAQGNEVGPFEQEVGRLAHFLAPLIAGLPSAEKTPKPQAGSESALLGLMRQVCARYPELVATLRPAVRDALDGAAMAMARALTETSPESQTAAVHEAADRIDAALDLDACRTAFLDLFSRLTLQDEEAPEDVRRGALIRFHQFADTLFLPHPQQRQEATLRLCAEFDPEQLAHQRTLWRQLRQVLGYENEHERQRIVLEMLEILTTQAFSAVAACDLLWGIGWAHGALSDFRLATSPIQHDGTLLSVTGGLQHRTLLQSLLHHWAEEDAVLGVGRTPHGEAPLHAGRERLDIGVFDEAELRELWALCVWRRDTPDPILLLELALKRLVHPEAFVRMRGYAEAHSTYGTLLAQPGATAVMGGKALLYYPGAILHIPLKEEVDEEASRAKMKLGILKRLFLPVSFRCEVLWQEAIARLDQPVYLHHEFQNSVRLADPWAVLRPDADEAPDPAIAG